MNSLPLPHELKIEAEKGNNNFEGLKIAHEKITWNGRKIPCMGRYGGHKWQGCLAQGFWMHEQHSRSVQSLRLAKVLRKHVMLTGTRIIIHYAIRLTTKLHIVFLVNQTLLMKILDLGTTKHEKLYNFNLYGSSPLMRIYLNNQQV